MAVYLVFHSRGRVHRALLLEEGSVIDRLFQYHHQPEIIVQFD